LQATHPEVSVVAVAEDRQAALLSVKAGARAALSKPLAPVQFRRVLQLQLGQGGQGSRVHAHDREVPGMPPVHRSLGRAGDGGEPSLDRSASASSREESLRCKGAPS
jgi:hypothetical protein